MVADGIFLVGKTPSQHDSSGQSHPNCGCWIGTIPGDTVVAAGEGAGAEEPRSGGATAGAKGPREQHAVVGNLESSVQRRVDGSPFAPERRQASEQYFTSSQQRSHFFRQVKGRWQTGQIFSGSGFFREGTGSVSLWEGQGMESSGRLNAAGRDGWQSDGRGTIATTPLHRSRKRGRRRGGGGGCRGGRDQAPKNLA